MRVFVTGAAGFIGQATVKELLAHGHSVVGLTRSDANTSILTAIGAIPLHGDIKDLDSLRRGARDSDGIIHLAMIHDFSDYAAACAADRAAIEAMGEVLAGSGKPLVIASGTLSCQTGVLATEDSEPTRDHPPFSLRSLSADLIYQLSKEKEIRGSVIRLPPTVYAEGKGGLTGMLIDTYRGKGGPVVYIGDGSARWPGCYRDDAATMFRLALEKGKPGATYHAVAEEGIPMKETAEMIGKNLGIPVESRSVEDATSVLGMFARVIDMDNPSSSEKTKKELGWEPVGPGLISDFEANFPH